MPNLTKTEKFIERHISQRTVFRTFRVDSDDDTPAIFYVIFDYAPLDDGKYVLYLLDVDGVSDLKEVQEKETQYSDYEVILLDDFLKREIYVFGTDQFELD